MVIAIFGESCTGKSTLAAKLSSAINAEVFTGKDYLRMAKNESIAKVMFQKKLAAAVDGEHVVYVISETEHLTLLPEGALRILVSADINLIKSRFAQRMHGSLPAPVAAMLEKKHGSFDGEPCDLHVITEKTDIDVICEEIVNLI